VVTVQDDVTHEVRVASIGLPLKWLFNV
jgi:hypothetical protein